MKLLQPVFLGIMALVLVGPSLAQTFTVPSEFWQAPRSGPTIRAEPQLQQAFTAYLKSDRAHLRLHHQKRDESIAQVEELRGWLIALGVEADRIEMTDDNPLNTIKLEIMDIR